MNRNHFLASLALASLTVSALPSLCAAQDPRSHPTNDEPAPANAPKGTPPSEDANAPKGVLPREEMPKETRSNLQELVDLMVGSFSSEKQHQEDAENFFDIRLHMAPIWRDISSDEKGYWLYVEQAVAAMPDKPYRQRVYHVTMEYVSDQSGTATPVFKSAVYLLPGTPADVLKFTGAWKDATKLDGVTPDKLIPRDGCTVVMSRTGEGRFEGATVGKGCPSERGGAKYATAEVHVNKDGLQTWDRGYNEKDEQVWGAEKGGYRFERVEAAQSPK
ncbi:MAG: chromophore lyase CpcT/CpeT [Phycisphaerales bacterium]|nr:chromophore lyase CpcT/CpeT [Phycisphaerales bacterium]